MICLLFSVIRFLPMPLVWFFERHSSKEQESIYCSRQGIVKLVVGTFIQLLQHRGSGSWFVIIFILALGAANLLDGARDLEMDEQLKTRVENKTKWNLVIKLWTRNGWVPIGRVERGCRHIMSHSLHWTFQDYVIETEYGLKLSINSDICCDHERIYVKESLDGKLVVDKEARKPFSLRRWFWSLTLSCLTLSCLKLSCLESKHDATEGQLELSTNSDDSCGFGKIYRPLKKIMEKGTHKPSRLCGEVVGFGSGYHQLIQFSVETFHNLLTKETK